MSDKTASAVLRIFSENDLLDSIDRMLRDLGTEDRRRLLRDIADACDARLEQLEDDEATDPDDGGQ